MRAVLDTVVFVRAAINSQSVWGRLIYERAESFTMVLSPEIFSEIFDVLNRPSLREKFPTKHPADWNRAINAASAAEVVTPSRGVSVCRDPDDNKFFECAVEGNAGYIVSEDKDILDIAEYEGVLTIATREFMDLVEQGGGTA